MAHLNGQVFDPALRESKLRFFKIFENPRQVRSGQLITDATLLR